MPACPIHRRRNVVSFSGAGYGAADGINLRGCAALHILKHGGMVGGRSEGDLLHHPDRFPGASLIFSAEATAAVSSARARNNARAEGRSSSCPLGTRKRAVNGLMAELMMSLLQISVHLEAPRP